jgi:hypothetical protein
LPRSSWAIGEKTTTRGAVLPLYFCALVCVSQSAIVFLKASSPSLPAYDSLYPKNAKTTSALVFVPAKRLSSWPPTGFARPLSHSSGVPKFLDRNRVAISSPLNARFLKTSSCLG